MKTDAFAPIQEAAEAFFKETGIPEPVVALDLPRQSEHGDIAISAPLSFAKMLGKKPLPLAEALAARLVEQDIGIIDSVEVAPPGFVNIRLSGAFFVKEAMGALEERTAWGHSEKHTGEKWVIEHTSPNPNKAMHLGHLRNNLVGMSLANLMESAGAHVVRDCVDNNHGIAIAKVMWGFLKHMRKDNGTLADPARFVENPELWLTPGDRGLSPDRFVTECYVLGEKDAKSDPGDDARIRQMVVDWEAGDRNIWKLWEHVLGYSYQGIERTLSRLGNRWDVVWHEHEHYTEGKRWVEEGLSRGIFKKLDDGAVLTDLSAYGLPDTILLKNDGTSLYITQDIALTAMKKQAYKADKLMWVIGPEQSLAMRQLFAVCEQLGIGKRSDFIHVSYGYVGLADEGGFKKMSSREGNVVLIDDVIDAVKKTVMQKLEEGADGGPGELEARAERLAVAAVKFSILKSHKDQQIAFDIERSTDVHGDSGVYILYTYARIRSVLRKGAEKGIHAALRSDDAALLSSGALSVLRILPQYAHALARSEQELSTHHVAQYLLEIAGAFNRWYSEEQFLDGSNAEAARLGAAEAVGVAIQSGLHLLGIETLEQI